MPAAIAVITSHNPWGGPDSAPLPLAELADRLAELPADVVVAYCRGYFCVMAPDAVRIAKSAPETPRRRHAQVALGRTTGRQAATAGRLRPKLPRHNDIADMTAGIWRIR